MDNITIARLLDETAALLEIDAADTFRIRSYRRAAEAVEQQTTQLATLRLTPTQRRFSRLRGSAKAWPPTSCDIVATGTMPLREELLQKYKPTMLELLRLPGMGPKTVALVWSALAGRRYRRSGRGREGRSPEQAPSHGREIHDQAAQGHRGLPQATPAASASIRRANMQTASLR